MWRSYVGICFGCIEARRERCMQRTIITASSSTVLYCCTAVGTVPVRRTAPSRTAGIVSRVCCTGTAYASTVFSENLQPAACVRTRGGTPQKCPGRSARKEQQQPSSNSHPFLLFFSVPVRRRRTTYTTTNCLLLLLYLFFLSFTPPPLRLLLLAVLLRRTVLFGVVFTRVFCNCFRNSQLLFREQLT